MVSEDVKSHSPASLLGRAREGGSGGGGGGGEWYVPLYVMS